MLSIASKQGPSDDELIREFEHLGQTLLPELLRRFANDDLREQLETVTAERDKLKAELELIS